MSQDSKKMYCPECLIILAKKNPKDEELSKVKNDGGLYHYKGSMDRHRQSAHDYVLLRDRK